jgi:2-hydroxychromene-2-carboxylate isomerase
MAQPPPILDFWFEFASTYSYPAAMRIADEAQARGVTLRWRPFLLGPLFKANGWTSSPFNIYPAKGRYMWRDLERICATIDLPFVVPPNFPQNTLLAARVALAGLTQNWGQDFCRAVYRAQFAEGRDIGDRTVIADVLKKLGQSADEAFTQAQSDAFKGRLRAQTEEAATRGIFGAPSFITADGELFWGNDRLETALDWVKRG